MRVKVGWRVVARTTPLVVVGVGVRTSLVVVPVVTPILVPLVVVPPLVVVSTLVIVSTLRVTRTQVVVVRPRQVRVVPQPRIVCI